MRSMHSLRIKQQHSSSRILNNLNSLFDVKYFLEVATVISVKKNKKIKKNISCHTKLPLTTHLDNLFLNQLSINDV